MSVDEKKYSLISVEPAQEVVQESNKTHTAQTKQEVRTLSQQEYKEEFGSNEDVPFSRMRILIIILLALFVVGFVIYCCFFY